MTDSGQLCQGRCVSRRLERFMESLSIFNRHWRVAHHDVELDILTDRLPVDVHLESSEEWFTSGMIPKPDLSFDELEQMIKSFLELWEKDDTYMFYVIDTDINQIVGIAFLNRINRGLVINQAAFKNALRPTFRSSPFWKRWSAASW